MDHEISAFDRLWDYDHPDVSETRFRDWLPRVQHDRDLHAQLLTQIARAQGLQGSFDAAHATLDSAAQLINGDLLRARIRLLLERGRVLNSSGDPAGAQPLFDAAWSAATRSGDDFYAIDAAHMLAIISPPDDQLAWNLRALELVERTCDARAKRWAASLYNNLGWTYHDRGEYAIALAYFTRALEQRAATGDSGPIRIARWCVARALRSLGRIDEALAIQQALRDEHARDGAQRGYVEEEIGECLLALGRSDEAQPYFACAYAELAQDRWLAANEGARLDRLRRLGAPGDSAAKTSR